MSITAARRRFAVLVAIAIAIAALPMLAQPVPAAATSGGTLFAITGMNQSVLSRIDPVTGVVTTMEDLAGTDQGQVVSLTGDPTTHRLFAIRSSMTFIPPFTINVKNELLTINSQTGAFFPSPSTSVPTWQIEFDPSSGKLYGLAHGATGGGTFGIFLDQLDLATGAGTHIALLPDVGSDVLGIVVAPGLHTVYVNDDSLGFGTPPGSRVLSVDVQTKAVTSSPILSRAVRNISYDSSSHLLFGTTECCPRDLVQIDPASGSETIVGNINDGSGIFTFPMATDPTTHSVFMDIQLPLDFINWEDHVVSINDVSGVATFSPPTGAMAWSLYFEPPVSAITPDNIRADVRSALSTGAIDSAGVANALLAQLNAAAAARATGDCSTAANIYNAFINALNAQGGRHIAAATATQLVSEAQFLIANCP